MSYVDQKQLQELPRLSIGHLLILTLTISVSLAFIAPAVHSTWKMPDEMFRGSKLAAISVPVVDHLAIGVKLFGLAVLVLEGLRSRPVNLSPGHWYFLIAGPIALFLLLSELIPDLVRSDWPTFDNTITAVFYLGAAIVGSRVVFVMQDWPWRVCLGLFAASLFMLSFLFAYRAAEIIGYARFALRLHAVAMWGSLVIAAFVAVLPAIANDIAKGTRRDWLHHSAVIAMGLETVGITQSFGPIISQWWRDLYFYVIG